MPGLMGMKRILALNDEAYRCDREERAGEDDEGPLKGDDRKEAERNREAARVWISGLEAVQLKLGPERVIDLLATRFFLRRSGYAEGTLLPWTASDFSLMDAITPALRNASSRRSGSVHNGTEAAVERMPPFVGGRVRHREAAARAGG